jgi:SpoIID/LytB domain protein
MLKQNHIPDTEPVVAIGIILPEDRVREIIIEIPGSKSLQYSLRGGAKTVELNPGTKIKLTLQDNKLKALIGEDYFLLNDISIEPEEQKKALSPEEGIKVKNVISGRDFHWKKHIDVYLPDTVKIKSVEDVLFLSNELPLEHYLMCVATSEMSAECPDSFIEAQTITARSWILAAIEQKHKVLGLDACNDDCCQRYQGTTYLSDQSVMGSLNTTGIVAVHNDHICDTRYSKSCGGVMETFDSIWEDRTIPYLKNSHDSESKPKEWIGPLSEENNFEHWVKSTPETYCSTTMLDEKKLKKYLGTVDEKGAYFRWEYVVSQEELTENINHYHNIQAKAISDLSIKKRGGGGRIILLEVVYIDNLENAKQLFLEKDFIIRKSSLGKL